MDYKQDKILAGRKVMLAYQSRSLRDLLTPIFKQIGAEVVLTGPALEMLKQIELAKPDIIFCEYQMETLDGPAFVGQVRREYRLKMPAILVADCQDGEAPIKSRAAGANEVLAMPFSVQDVTAIVKRALDRPEAHVLRFGPRPKPEGQP